jgi:hypothetical protein
MYIGLHEVPVNLVFFYKTLIFLTDLRKTTQISNFMKILPVGDELFHADGRTDGQTQTDMVKLTVVICNFTNTLKN